MQYRELGKSGLKVSEVSLGCWTMGGLNWVNGTPNGWANVDEDEITAAIKTGIDAGVNHFDNADVYGNGKAEQMLARVFDKLGLRSTDYVVATKVGHFPGTAPHAYEKLHIRHQCEQSLVNLKREYIDLYYFHHGSFGESDMYLDDAVDMMNRLVEEGKVRFKGQSAYSASDFVKLVPKVQPVALQSWANALDDQFIRPGSVVSNLLVENEISFVAFSPLAQGLLLDKFDPKNPPSFDEGDHRRGKDAFGTERLEALKPKLAVLKEKFGATIEDLSAIAQRYILNMPNVACTIPGFRNERQVRCNLSAVGRELSADDIRFIQDTLA